MRAWIPFLLARRWAVLAAWSLVAVLGALAWRALPIDAFPDVTNIQVMILASAEGLSTADVETQVTYPIEGHMGGLPDVREVRSLSRAGLSQVVVVFADDVDPFFARQLVFERLTGVRELLPDGVEPELAPLSTGLGEIFQYTVEGEGLTLLERRAIQDWLVAPRLRAVPGITEVNSLGGEVGQVQVVVHPERLAAHGLELRQVLDAVARSNANAGAGYVLKGWEQAVVRGVGALRSLDDVERIGVAAPGGVPVLLRDLADVRVAGGPRQGAVTRDGRGETVAGMAIMLRGANSRTVVTAVREAVARIGASLPEGVRLDVFYDRTDLIRACVRTVSDALVQGGILVVIVLFLFVAELRTALVVVLSLPITFLATFLAMRFGGLSANLMTVGGLAFSVGMVVDASIVVAENIRRHLGERREAADRRAAVLAAVTEVARPVAFSVLVIVLVLVPLLTLQGLEGKMFRPLAWTLLASLLASILVALTLVPAVSEWWMRQREVREPLAVQRLRRGYLALLRRAMARPGLTVGASLAVLAATLLLVPRLGTDFLPPLDEGAIAINVVRLPTANLAGSVAVSTLIERRLGKLPEVATVVSKSGRAEISEDPMGPEQTDVFVMLRERRAWRAGMTKAKLVEAIHAELAAIPGLRPAFSQPIALRVNELISGVKGDLAVKVFGPDLAVLKGWADGAAAAVSGVEGARDVKVEQAAGMAELEVAIDRDAIARYGLTVGDVNDVLETAGAGRTVGRFADGERRLDLVVRFPERARNDAAALAALLVPTPAGARIPLGQLAAIRLVEGPMQISREGGMRRVVVEANVRGRDLGSFVAAVQGRLAPLVAELPAGYFVEYGGQFENQRRAMRQLAIVVPVVLLLIGALLYSALGTARHAALVLVNLPFAVVGGVVAAVIFGMPVTVSAAVAFIVLLGIAVQNGVVLVAYFRQLLARGLSVDEAIEAGCGRRFTPLLMTALTSFIGHMPMVWATGSGADIQKPLAVIVMGGIVTSTVLTLLVLPVLFRRLELRRPSPATP